MINYSTSQIVVIDIIVNLAVVFFRHNESERKVMQYSLNSRFPFTLIVLHTYKLADKRNLISSSAYASYYLITYFCHTTRDVVIMFA